ncbi:MAG: hypothetical protein Q9194_006628 [Teloschistes cf. exilis]
MSRHTASMQLYASTASPVSVALGIRLTLIEPTFFHAGLLHNLVSGAKIPVVQRSKSGAKAASVPLPEGIQNPNAQPIYAGFVHIHRSFLRCGSVSWLQMSMVAQAQFGTFKVD